MSWRIWTGRDSFAPGMGRGTQYRTPRLRFGRRPQRQQSMSRLETFRGATRTAEHLRPDLIRTRFRPDLDLKSHFSGPNQVEIGSKSGPNQVRAEVFGWVGAREVGPRGRVPVAPPESL